MRFGLTTWVGDGTELSPFRPDGITAGRWAVIDLRPNPTQLAGRCFYIAESAAPSRVDDLGEESLDDTLSPVLKRRLENALGLTAEQPTLRGVIAELLLLHGRQDGTRWRPLRANRRGRHRIVLLDRVLYDAPPIVGTVITETFNQANSTVLGPDLTWAEVFNDFSTISNEGNLVTQGGTGSARAETDLASDDHYAQARCEPLINNNARAGVAVRFAAAAETYYGFTMIRGATDPARANTIFKMVAGTETVLASNYVQIVVGSVLRLEVDGSTLDAYDDGVLHFSTTDTSITGNLRTGIVGVSAGGSSRGRWDNFEAGDLAAGTPHTATQTDPEGLLDSISQITTSARTPVDPLGLFDAATPVADYLRPQTDALGLTDAATATQSHVRTIDDVLGLSDSQVVRRSRLSNTLEGGVDGTAITPANSGGASGDAFDVVALSGGGAVVFDDDAGVADGVFSALFSSNVATAQLALVAWDPTSWQVETEVWTRMYFRADAMPGQGHMMVRLVSGLAHCCAINFEPDGKLTLGDATFQIRYTSSLTLAVDTLYRIEWHVVHSATVGHMEARIFHGANLHGTIPDETFGNLTDNWNTRALSDTVEFGRINTAQAVLSEWFDEIAIDNIDWIGPVAGGGVGHTATQTDAEGLLDSVTQVVDSTRPLTDPLGLLDAVVAEAVFNRSQIDPLNLTDNIVVAGEYLRLFTDPLSLLDSITQAVDSLRTQTDALGLTDSVSYDLTSSGAVTQTDPLNLTDNITFLATYEREQTDTLGMTDSIIVELTHNVTLTDVVGLLDSLTSPVAMERTTTDALGLTDTTTQAASFDRIQTDALDLLDSMLGGFVFEQTITDLLSLLDDLTYLVTVNTIFEQRDKRDFSGGGRSYNSVGRDHTSRNRDHR